MTKVVNLRHEPYDEYIGRGSLLGNPYVIGRDGSRSEVIELYRKRFYRLIKETNFCRAVESLRGKILGWFCKLLPCHGDIVVEYLEGR